MKRTLSRRRFLGGAGATLATGSLMALIQSCGDDDDGDAGNQATPPPGTSGTPAAAPTSAPSRADRLRMAGGQWGHVSPFAYNRGPGLAHSLFGFDTLTWKDATGEVIPWLSPKWEMAPDGLRYTYTIREKAAWHDGTPLTAEDVAFTFDYFINGPGRKAAGIVGQISFIDKVTVSGTNALEVSLKEPYAPFDVLVAGRMPILPKHIWSSVDDPAKYRDARALVGSGPFRIDSVDETAGAYRYVANADFYLGRPAVGALEFVPAADELLSLERGELDAGSPPTEDGVPEGALKPFEDQKTWGSLDGDGEWARSLHINMAKPFPFNDRQFRQAVAYAIDRKDIVKRLLLGVGEPGSLGGLAPSHPMINKELPTYDLDVAKARALLDGIGLKDTNGDGFRELPDGSKFEPELQTSTRYSPKAAELVKEYLRAAGIDVKVTSLNSNTADDNAAKGNYELSLVGYGGFGGDPDALRTRFSANVKSQSFSRAVGYANARFEELAAKQLGAVKADERAVMVREMQGMIAEDVPIIPLYLPKRILLYRREVFEAWYYTPGGIFGGYPGVLNKHAFTTGRKSGF